ncbi:MAG: RNA polymerase sigma factor [Acidobacteria bacterium]|nr:RNA polymerase sigma factor [Acidobacteriota bacterium]
MDVKAKLEAEVVALYEVHASELTRYAAGLAHSEDLASDAVQETFLRYFVERSYGRLVESPRAWLYQVLRHYLFDRMNSASATREVGHDDLSGLSDPGHGPEDLVRRSEIAREVASTLSVRERECLGLRSEGFAYGEIADILGLRIGTVGALLARAHKKVRDAAAKAEAHDDLVAGAVQYLFHAGGACPST